MKKILIVDWLDKYGGAERVLTVLNKQFDFDKCFTLINIMSNSDLNRVFNDKKIKIVRSLVGNYCTSLEMQGASITLTKLDPELVKHWDSAVHTPAIRWGM